MTLEKIIEIYNEINDTSWVVLRQVKSSTTIAPGLKEQVIKIVSPLNDNVAWVMARDVSTEDKSNKLEEHILKEIFGLLKLYIK